jgi:hypothetical protein
MVQEYVKDVNVAPYSGVVLIKINVSGGWRLGTGYLLPRPGGAMVVTAAHNVLWPSAGINAVENPAMLELFTGVTGFDEARNSPVGAKLKRYTARACEVPKGFSDAPEDQHKNVFFDAALIEIAEPVTVDGKLFAIDRAELVFEEASRAMAVIGFDDSQKSKNEKCRMRIAQILTPPKGQEAYERSVAGYFAPDTTLGPGWSGSPIIHYWPPNQPQLSGAPSVGIHLKQLVGDGPPFLGYRFHPENIDWFRSVESGKRKIGAAAGYRVRASKAEKESTEVETGGDIEGAGKLTKPKKATGAGGSPKTAEPAKKGVTVEGDVAASSARYYKLTLKEGETVKFTIYTRLPNDASAVTGSFAVQDEEGGVLSKTSFLVSASGEDFDREIFEYEAEETGPHLFRIRSEDSDAERVTYKIKIA